MAKDIHKLATAMGARIVGRVPDVGPGAFGASRLAEFVRARLSPSVGLRPGRPTDAKWVHRPKIPMSDDTFQQLERLARQLSTSERKVSAMQVAAHLLEESLKVVDGSGVKL